MTILPRLIQKSLEERLFHGKIIIIYGARQVGKTTLVKQILANYKGKSLYLNCELLSVQQGLNVPEAERLKNYLGDHQLVVLDEAQKINNIGIILKILVDTYPEMQIIATGSSSFELANQTSEPLTGRVDKFVLYPFSLEEIYQADHNRFAVEAKLEKIMTVGSYPEVFFLDQERAIERLNEISSNYLYKDILSFEGLKKSNLIVKLLQLLALQIGSEVSYQELAQNLGVSRLTVQKYIDLLEFSFVIFILHAFSRNKRKEISKSVKIYFYDLGIRNSLIQNYNQLSLRNDSGMLWENLMIVERVKSNAHHGVYANQFFWRTYNQQEIDYVEERDGKISAFEFKWRDTKVKEPKIFLESYQNSEFKIINRENYWDFVYHIL